MKLFFLKNLIKDGFALPFTSDLQLLGFTLGWCWSGLVHPVEEMFHCYTIRTQDDV